MFCITTVIFTRISPTHISIWGHLVIFNAFHLLQDSKYHFTFHDFVYRIFTLFSLIHFTDYIHSFIVWEIRDGIDIYCGCIALIICSCYKFYFLSIWVNKYYRIPVAICIGTNRWVLVCHRVDTQPSRQHLAPVIAGTVVVEA